MLSKKCKYALKALLAIARNHNQKEPLQSAHIAEEEQIPRKFLELILTELKQHGFLSSKKGKGGGYVLNRSADDITIGQVIRMVEGPLALIPCVSQTAYKPCDDCPDEAICGVHFVMKDLREATVTILDQTTLGELIERVNLARANTQEVPMFFI